MSNVINFDFNQQSVRIVEHDREPWFVAADVCQVLGLQPKHVMGRLEVGEKSMVARNDLGLNPGRPMLVVSESGLYNLIMRSDKPEARPFQNWVTRDVLPAIRKDGGYVIGEEKLKTGEMDENEFIARALQLTQSKLKKAREHIAEMKPKAERYDQLIDAEGTLTTTNVAHSLGISAERLNQFLRERGVKYKREDQPIVEFLNKGWFKVRFFVTETGRVVASTRITPTGAAAITEMYLEVALSQ